jgi:hypothetical protein
MRDDADADVVVELFRLNYDRVTERHERSARQANERRR